MNDFGNQIFNIVRNTKFKLFNQGKYAQLTYQALDAYVTYVNTSKEENIKVSYPVGYTPSKEAILSESLFSKSKLNKEYNFLGLTQLPTNGIYHLTTLMETMFSDILRAVFTKYPEKMSSKKQIAISDILSLSSIELVHLEIINKTINEIAYKSPKDFVAEFEKFVSINLFETPAMHHYLEIKATRDIYIHNMGIVNSVYIDKSASHARAKDGQELPINIQYFLESYEYCLQLCEFLEKEFHRKWHSSEYEETLKK